MGICHSKTNENFMLSTQIIKDQNFPNLELYFSTESLLRKQGDCLALFVDRSFKLNKDRFLLKIGKTEAKKVQQFAEASLRGKIIQVGHCYFFRNEIEDLKFDTICLICVNTWSGHKSTMTELSLALNIFIDKIVQKKYQMVTIAQANIQLGYPCNNVASIIYKSIFQKREGLTLKQLTILFEEQQNQNLYINCLKTFKGYKDVSEKSVKQSIYF